jgi:hypothetical protein
MMFSVGLSEVIVVCVVAVLALKPEQMIHATKMCRKLWADWNAWRASFDVEQLRLEKERALAERIANASTVSDVSDLLKNVSGEKSSHDA